MNITRHGAMERAVFRAIPYMSKDPTTWAMAFIEIQSLSQCQHYRLLVGIGTLTLYELRVHLSCTSKM
jgi:hypothetical protein